MLAGRWRVRCGDGTSGSGVVACGLMWTWFSGSLSVAHKRLGLQLRRGFFLMLMGAVFGLAGCSKAAPPTTPASTVATEKAAATSTVPPMNTTASGGEDCTLETPLLPGVMGSPGLIRKIVPRPLRKLGAEALPEQAEWMVALAEALQSGSSKALDDPPRGLRVLCEGFSLHAGVFASRRNS